MKPVFCITSDIHEEDREIVFGILYSFNTLGYEEMERASGISVKSYFEDHQAVIQVERNIAKNIPHAILSSDEVIFQDWNKNWKDSIDPVLLSENIWVSPSWCKPEMKKKDSWIKIEPKMAFGTGRHESTRLAAQALVSLGSPPKKTSLLDIGTGSGILCFVGNILGYSMSIGIDNDLWCAGSLIENREINRAAPTTSFAISSIESIREKKHFHIIIVNMIRGSSEDIIKISQRYLLKNGYLIWSGLLYEEKAIIKQFLRIHEWSIVSENHENEWMCYILKKDEG